MVNTFTDERYGATEAAQADDGMAEAVFSRARKSEAEAPITANILLVDDDPNSLSALADMLGSLGQNVVQARSGNDALRVLLQKDFAIVLLDVQMPDMDGYELAALIRERERLRDVPIIFMTAVSQEDISRGYALGAVDYVFKPIDPVVLRAKIAVFADLYKKTEAVRRQAEHERRLQMENLRVRSEKIEAERALRQVEERQSLIIRSLPIALYTADLEGGFSGPRFLSESIAGAVGFKASEFIEDPDLWSSRIHPSDRARVLAQVEAIAETGSASIEYRWRCADGAEKVFLDQAVLVRDEAGEPKEILGTCLDVTYRRQLEQQLAHSQKMEAIGQLTGGIAHDFNNMLSVIIWNLDVVTRALKGSGKLYDRSQMALNGALNCAELIRQLLAFARHQPRQPKVIDVSELVPRMAKMLAPVLGERIKVGVSLQEGIWPVFADPAQIESILLNLAINSRDAMPDGGTLIVECANIRHDSVDLEPEPGEYVTLAVTDTGAGMPQEVIDRAFEPFFTTKESGKGSGLGLSMVYGFAKQSGGHVTIESKVGIGTTVRIYLPRAEAMAAAAAASDWDNEPDIVETGRTILVVEDDADVRGVTVARLQDIGHKVLEADGANAALEILRNPGDIDLLFTDVVMPGGMSGLDLAQRACELRPGLKVIYASGYASSFHASRNVPGELLQKPYSDQDLRAALSRMLGSASASPPEDVESSPASPLNDEPRAASGLN
jgi:PAS domain S-box-containing protein